MDATNIVQPLVTVITNIAHDHHEHLGSGLLHIAAEKAGIIKPGAPLVTMAPAKAGAATCSRSAAGNWARPCIREACDFNARGGPAGKFRYQGLHQELTGLSLTLHGPAPVSQRRPGPGRAGVAGGPGLSGAGGSHPGGLAATRWPGRLEQVAQDPRIILDGAHNPAAALTLAQALKQSRGNGRLILVLGVMADKDVDGILARLLPLAQMVIFTQPRISGRRPRLTCSGGPRLMAWRPCRSRWWPRPSKRPSPWPGPTTASSLPGRCSPWGRPNSTLPRPLDVTAKPVRG